MCNTGSLRTAGNSRGSIWMCDRNFGNVQDAAAAGYGPRNITVGYILISAKQPCLGF